METYTLLRQFADSWGMLGMLLCFAVAAVWTFRPGAAKGQHEAAMQIFRNEDRPKDDTDGR